MTTSIPAAMNLDDECMRKEFIDRHSRYHRKSKIEGHNGIRIGYHEDGFSSPGDSIQRMRREIASQIEISSDDHVVDIGCGFGDCLVWLAEKDEISGTGIDIAPPQIDVARDLAEEHGVSNQVDFVTADFHDLSSIVSNSPDIIWSCRKVL